MRKFGVSVMAWRKAGIESSGRRAKWGGRPFATWMSGESGSSFRAAWKRAAASANRPR